MGWTVGVVGDAGEGVLRMRRCNEREYCGMRGMGYAALYVGERISSVWHLEVFFLLGFNWVTTAAKKKE